MENTTLKRLRVIIPGVIILLLLLLLIYDLLPLFFVENNKHPVFSFLSIIGLSVSTILAIFFGALYKLSNLRWVFFQKPIENIRGNIKAHFQKKFISEPEILSKICALENDKPIMNIFFDFIDNDNSLSEKAKNVRFNGIFLSSIADIMILALIFGPIYLIAYIYYNHSIYLVWTSIALTILFILCLVHFLPKTTKDHIDLSNEQLDLITRKYTTELRDELDKLS